MKGDPAIEAIRKTRHEISRRFGHNTKALIAHYDKMQEKYADRVVVAEPSAAYTSSFDRETAQQAIRGNSQPAHEIQSSGSC